MRRQPRISVNHEGLRIVKTRHLHYAGGPRSHQDFVTNLLAEYNKSITQRATSTLTGTERSTFVPRVRCWWPARSRMVSGQDGAVSPCAALGKQPSFDADPEDSNPGLTLGPPLRRKRADDGTFTAISTRDPVALLILSERDIRSIRVQFPKGD